MRFYTSKHDFLKIYAAPPWTIGELDFWLPVALLQQCLSCVTNSNYMFMKKYKQLDTRNTVKYSYWATEIESIAYYITNTD
jgi:hypothetical protein